MRTPVLIPLLLAVALSACGHDASNADAGDAGTSDGTVLDSGPAPDTGATPDAGQPADVGTPDTGVDGGVVDVQIPGLTGPVTISFDDFGVTHILCESNADCFAAQGYAHASHRFGQMDLQRRFSRGTLAEIFGPPALDQDREARSFLARRDGSRIEDVLLANANADTVEGINAYVRGVNAWIEDLRNNRNGATLTDEWASVPIDDIADWTAQDSIAGILLLVEQLTNDSGVEIRRGEQLAQLPAAQFEDFFGLRPGHPSTILPRPTARQGHSNSIVDGIRDVRNRLFDARFLLREAAERMPAKDKLQGWGSNNWVVAPSQATDNKALLSNDPHLGLSNPSVWYINSIDSKAAGMGGNIKCAGVSLPGLPGVIIGQNENVAWGATTTFFDQADVYIEDVVTSSVTGDPIGVRLNGNLVRFVEADFTFGIAGANPVTETFLYVPHHGPVISLDNTMAVTVRWSAQDMTTDLNFLFEMLTSTNVTEAKAALSNFTAVGQNWVIADTSGNIAWFPANALPDRPWASSVLAPWLPLPGDGTAEWMGTIPLASIPQAENPSDGYLSTANNDMTGNLWDGDPTNDGTPYWQNYVATGYRHARIIERLEDGAGTHNRATMESILADVHSLLGEETAPRIIAAGTAGMANLSSDGQSALAALAAWDYQCPTGLTGNTPSSPATTDPTELASAVGCMTFHSLFPKIHDVAFLDETTTASVGRAKIDAVISLLIRPSQLVGGEVYWDDVTTPGVTETSTMGIVAALNATGAYLAGEFGADSSAWIWGRKHTVTLSNQINAMYSNGPFANDGGLFTVDVANPTGAFNDSYSHPAGPSIRLACDADTADGVGCTIQLPGGQRMFSTSPFYDDLMMRWLDNDPIPLRIEPTDFEPVETERLVINPAN